MPAYISCKAYQNFFSSCELRSVRCFVKWRCVSWFVKSREVNYVEVGVRIPTTLLPLDLREVLRPSTELACVLGCELLCGDCAAPVDRGGVGPTEVSMVGGGMRPSAIWEGNGAQ